MSPLKPSPGLFYALSAALLFLFAVWTSLYSRSLASRSEEELAPRRALLLRRTRWIAVGAGILQLLILIACGVASAKVGRRSPLPTLWYLAVSLLQGQLQFSLERRLRRLRASAAAHLTLWLRGLAAALAGAGLALVIYLALMVAFGLALRILHFPAGLRIIATLLALPVSILVSARTVAGLAPLLVRLAVPCRRLEDAGTAAMLEDCFRKAGLEIPSLWIMEGISD